MRPFHPTPALFSVVLAGALLVAAPALAQQTSPGVDFIKAVKERDGAKAQSLIAAPGSTVVSSRDPSSGDSALHITIKRRDVPWTNFMIQRGVDPNVADRAGDTPLGLAARIGFSEGARALIAGGARVDGANARGETPLIIAVQARRLDIVQMLARNGADPDKADGAAGYSARDYAKQDRRSAAILRVLEEKRTAPKAAGPTR